MAETVIVSQTCLSKSMLSLLLFFDQPLLLCQLLMIMQLPQKDDLKHVNTQAVLRLRNFLLEWGGVDGTQKCLRGIHGKAKPLQ